MCSRCSSSPHTALLPTYQLFSCQSICVWWLRWGHVKGGSEVAWLEEGRFCLFRGTGLIAEAMTGGGLAPGSWPAAEEEEFLGLVDEHVFVLSTSTYSRLSREPPDSLHHHHARRRGGGLGGCVCVLLWLWLCVWLLAVYTTACGLTGFCEAPTHIHVRTQPAAVCLSVCVWVCWLWQLPDSCLGPGCLPDVEAGGCAVVLHLA